MRHSLVAQALANRTASGKLTFALQQRIFGLVGQASVTGSALWLPASSSMALRRHVVVWVRRLL